MLDAHCSNSPLNHLEGFLVEDPMAVDPAYFFDIGQSARRQSRDSWLSDENETCGLWLEGDDELSLSCRYLLWYDRPQAHRRAQYVVYPAPWLSDPEEQIGE